MNLNFPLEYDFGNSSIRARVTCNAVFERNPTDAEPENPRSHESGWVIEDLEFHEITINGEPSESPDFISDLIKDAATEEALRQIEMVTA